MSEDHEEEEHHENTRLSLTVPIKVDSTITSIAFAFDAAPRTFHNSLQKVMIQLEQLLGLLSPAVTVPTQEVEKQVLQTRTVYAGTILTESDNVVLVDATSGEITITLLPAASLAGQQLQIEKSDASANTVTINTATVNSVQDKIENDTIVTLTSQFEKLEIISGGAQTWYRS